MALFSRSSVLLSAVGCCYSIQTSPLRIATSVGLMNKTYFMQTLTPIVPCGNRAEARFIYTLISNVCILGSQWYHLSLHGRKMRLGLPCQYPRYHGHNMELRMCRFNLPLGDATSQCIGERGWLAVYIRPQISLAATRFAGSRSGIAARVRVVRVCTEIALRYQSARPEPVENDMRS